MKVPVCVFVIVRSGLPDALIVVGSDAESLDVFVSPPPDTVAVLVTDDGALFATLTFRVIGEPLEEAETALEVVQVTVWPETLHDQPVPVAACGVIPVGTESSTVIVPLEATLPILLTVNVYDPVPPCVKVPV